VKAHRSAVGLVDDLLAPLVAADAPPRFTALLASLRDGTAGGDTAILAHNPLAGASRSPYDLGAELLAATAAGPFAGNAERIAALRENASPHDDLALLLGDSDAPEPRRGSPPREELAVARAVGAVDAFLGVHPAPADRRLWQAQRLADAGEGPAALALLEQVLALNPRCAAACAVRGQVLERGGDKAGALLAYE